MNSSKINIEQKIHTLIDGAARKNMNPQEWISFSEKLDTMLDELQAITLSDDNSVIDCKAGCSFCCNHWVEDVYFFESLSIINYLKENASGNKLEEIRETAQKSECEFLEIYESESHIDEVTLLNRFYDKQIACPLLNDDGKCIVYEVRPLTCRSFFSESAEKHCNPQTRNRDAEGTYMVTPGDEIETKLDELHLAYGENFPLSLRAMLAFMV